LRENWPRLTRETAAGPRHQQLLAVAENIGIKQGDPEAGNYCSIDLDVTAEVEPFLEINPGLLDALRTKRGRGCNIWLQMKGDYPPGGKLHHATTGKKLGEWRSTGDQTLIHGKAGGRHYKQVSDSSLPLLYRFEDIVWPGHFALSWAGKETEPAEEEAPATMGEEGWFFVDKKHRQLDEHACARAFLEGHPLVYEETEGSFFIYEGATGAFDRRSKDEVHKRLFNWLSEQARAIPSSALAASLTYEKVRRAVNALVSVANERQVFERAKADYPGLIHAANTMLHVTADGIEVLPFAPVFYSRNPLGVEYIEGATCPRFESELLWPLFQDAGMIRSIGEFMGMVVYGRNLTAQIALIEGEGGAGKTCFGNIVKRLAGKDNVRELTMHLGGEFGLANYVGRTLAVGMDVVHNFLDTPAASLLKKLVGDDGGIAANIKYVAEPKILDGDLNILITSNSRQNTNIQEDYAAWERRVVPYQVIPPREQDVKRGVFKFHDVLVDEEGPGILNFALRGLQALLCRLQENSKAGLYMTDAMRGNRDDLLKESQGVERFVEERVEARQGGMVTCDELRLAFRTYSQAVGWRVVSARDFNQRVDMHVHAKFGVVLSRSIPSSTGDKQGYRGIALKP